MAKAVSFYDMKEKKKVMKTEYDTKRLGNGRLQAIADHKGRKLYTFLKG